MKSPKKQYKGAHMTQMISCSAQVCWGPLALAFSVQVSLALLMPPPRDRLVVATHLQMI